MRQRRAMFHGSELPRLLTMLVALGVLALLMGKARDPRLWTWFAAEDDPVPAEKAVESSSPEGDSDDTSESPPDEDPEQRTVAAEEFQAITDRTTNLGPEEMPAYWRLLQWSDAQSVKRLSRRARSDVVFNDFVQSADAMRGKPVRIDLNVRRVLAYDAPSNPLGVERLYEIWGWSDESKAWLYVGVTADLPPGMPTGPSVHERATFYGYFLKLQGYLEAGAEPRAKPLMAPLLLGRIVWRPSAPPPASSDDTWWVIALGTLLALGLIWRFARYAWPGRSNSAAAMDPQSLRAKRVDEWLEQVESQNNSLDPQAGEQIDLSPLSEHERSTNGRG